MKIFQSGEKILKFAENYDYEKQTGRIGGKISVARYRCTALVETRETENHDIFRKFMTEIMERQLATDIAVFEASMEESPMDEEPVGKYAAGNISEDPGPSLKSLKTTSEKIIALLRNNPRHSARTLAETIGITEKGIEKQLAKLKSQGLISRIGPAKGGYWEVVKGM